jgi:hypothetical protein
MVVHGAVVNLGAESQERGMDGITPNSTPLVWAPPRAAVPCGQCLCTANSVRLVHISISLYFYGCNAPFIIRSLFNVCWLVLLIYLSL